MGKLTGRLTAWFLSSCRENLATARLFGPIQEDLIHGKTGQRILWRDSDDNCITSTVVQPFLPIFAL